MVLRQYIRNKLRLLKMLPFEGDILIHSPEARNAIVKIFTNYTFNLIGDIYIRFNVNLVIGLETVLESAR